MADAEAYKKIVDDLVVSKAKAAQHLATTESVKTKVGQEIVNNATGGNFEFGVAAKKGRDKSRENLAAKGQIDEQKALAAAQKEYQQTLRKTMEEGGTAEDAIKSFIEVMQKYKLEVKNADEVQQQFQQDMDKIVNTAMNTTDTKGGLDRNIKRQVSTNQSQSQAAANLVNAQPIQDVVNGYKEQEKVEGQIIQENEKIHNQNVQAATDQQKLTKEAQRAGQEQIEKQKQIIAEAQRYVSVQDSIRNSFDALGRGAKRILSITTAWRSLRNVVKSTFNDVKSLDKSFASIAMVTEYSVKDMWEQYDQYAAMANKLGQSTQSVVEASGLYYQQGLKTNEVLKLTEETMKLATLAGLDFKEATSQMTAALRAFHMDMSEGAHVTDVYAEVAAHAAVDVQGLSEAMSATAAIANSAGMSFENTTAMLATMVEATQEAPKNLGTAMKTILARFTELKTNVAGTADSEFDDLDYNKVDKALKSVGVSIKDATGQFRNMDEVLLELSSKWKGLDRNSQRYIATIAAGSRQQSRFIALMENYERTMELVDVAQNSAGRSSQQFAKYQDTVEYRVNKIKNSWEQFRTSLLDSDAYKGALDTFSGFLDKLNDMSTTGLVTLAGTWMTLGRKAVSGTINMVSSGMGRAFAPKSKTEFTQQYQQTNTDATQEQIDAAYEEAKAKSVIKGQALGTAISASITSAVTTGLTANNAWQAAGLSLAGSAIPSIMAGFQIGGGMGAAVAFGLSIGSAALSGLINWIKNEGQKELNKTIEKQVKNAQKALDESTEKLEQKQAEARGTQNTIKDLENIKKQYDELKNKVVLTEEEQKKYSDLVSNLKENYPSLIAAYDEETGKIKLNNQLLEQRKKTLTELEKQQSAAALQEQFYNTGLANKKSELDIKNKYYSELKSTLNLSSNEIEALSKSIANVNSSNIEDFKKSVEDLAKKNEASEETLQQIHTTLEDFEASYISNSHNENRETYETVLTELRKNNENLAKSEQLSDAQLRIRAERIMKEADTAHYEGSNEKGKLNSVLFDVEYGEKYEDRRQWAYDHGLGEWGTITSGFAQWGGLTKWDNLSTRTKNILEEANITQEEYDKYEKEDDYDRMIAFLEQKFEALYKSNTYKNLANTGATEKEKKQGQELENYKDEYSKDSLEEFKNKIKELQDLGVTDYTLNATFPIEEVKQYEDLLNKLYLTNSKTFKNLPIEVIESQGQIFQGLIDKFGESGDLGKTYEKFVQSIKGLNLTSDLQNTLLRFNPADLDGMTKNEARETLMSLFQSAIDDGKIGEEAAKKTVDSYLNELENSNLGNFSILSTNALNKIEEEVKEKYNKIVTNYKTAIDTINSNITNGFIDFLDKDKIEDAIKELNLDPSDYIFTDEKGNYQVDVEALNEDVKQQAQDESKITEEIKAQIQNGIDQLKQKEDLIQSIINQCQGEQENYKIQKKLTAEYAKQNALRNDKDLKDIETQYDIDWNDDGSALISSKTLSDLEKGLNQITTQREELEKSLKDDKYIQSLVNIAKSASNKIDQTFKTYTDTTENLKKENDKAYKDWIDKTKAVTEAQKNLTKAIETVAEKQKELKEVIEGTNWKSSVDGMYNYNTALDFLTKQTERAKKKLEKAGSIAEAKNNFQIYGQGLLDQKAQLTAQNQTYRTAYNNIGKVYNNDVAKLINSFEDSNKMKFNLADYLTFDEKTGTKINMNALQKAKMPEALKKWIESQGQKANEYLGKILDNEDKIEQLNEEFLEQQKKARDEYINLQDQMIDVLREKYQQEIDDLQNKYDAMNEADNKYLESLQKNLDRQRKLRDQEKNWNDLTNKERKLSLMQRDTSGGNLADVKNLQEEIDDQRTQLLDDAVDQIIEKLTEFYELQREARDAEIEYKQTLIDDVALLKEATEALEKIQTSDDLVNWWKENVTGIEAFSKEKLDKLTQDWNDLFNAKSNYVASIDKTMLDSITETNGHLKDVSDEATHIVETTSEGITELAEKSLQEAGDEYKEAIKKAKEALKDAQDAVQKQKEALQAAIEAAKEAQKAFNEIAAKYKESLSKAPKTETVYVVNGTKTTDKDHVPTLIAQEVMHGNTNPTITTEKVTERESKQITQEEKDLQNSKPSGNWGTPSKTKNVEFMQRGDSIYTTTEWQKNAEYKKGGYGAKTSIEIPYTTTHGVLKYNEKSKKWEFVSGSSSDTIEEAKEYIEKQIKKSISSSVPTSVAESMKQTERKKYYAFAEGGLVNYTGPAWVDGSRSKPEAFLSSEDTRRIGEAARILADLPILSQPIKEQVPTTTIGDTTIQIDVHVDSIANDYDLDEAMNKVEQRIVNAAKYAGSNVILKKH